jgi:predicted nucleic acid-binding protein
VAEKLERLFFATHPDSPLVQAGLVHLFAAGLGQLSKLTRPPGSAGAFELVASPLLPAELERALAYPKLRNRIHESEPTAIVEWLERFATIVQDPDEPASRASKDPGDDYLIAFEEPTRCGGT